MARFILAYGGALAALSLFIHQTGPAENIILITGTAGGGLCLLWGIAALAGFKRRVGVILTMIAVGLVVLSQAVQAWLASTDAASTGLIGPLVLTLMLLTTIGMLMYILHGERPPEFYDTSNIRHEAPSPRQEPTPRPGAGRQP